MNSNSREFQRLYLDNYGKSFDEDFKRRDTIDAKIIYVDWQIQLMKQRLNRYLEELNPNIYAEDKQDIDKVRLYIATLEDLRVELERYNTDKLFKWLIDYKKVELLHDQLQKHNFIDNSTSLEVFAGLFSEKKAGRIIWLKMGKNKDVNKKSIFNLLEILKEYNVISYERLATKTDVISVLNSLFQSINRQPLRFSLSNYTPDSKSNHDKVLREIVFSIL